LEEQWEEAFEQLEVIKDALGNEYLVAGGIFSVEPHKNTTNKSKKGKNTKAGKPHFHAVIWFYHQFSNPSIQKLKLKLADKGISTRADDLDTPLDEVKTTLYVIKEKDEPTVQDLCNALGKQSSIFVWAVNRETREWFAKLHKSIGEEKASFSMEDLPFELPTTKRHSDDGLLLAEFFGKYFKQSNLALRDDDIYQKVEARFAYFVGRILLGVQRTTGGFCWAYFVGRRAYKGPPAGIFIIDL
jgi:hypothetical protein